MMLTRMYLECTSSDSVLLSFSELLRDARPCQPPPCTYTWHPFHLPCLLMIVTQVPVHPVRLSSRLPCSVWILDAPRQLTVTCLKFRLHLVCNFTIGTTNCLNLLVRMPVSILDIMKAGTDFLLYFYLQEWIEKLNKAGILYNFAEYWNLSNKFLSESQNR